MISPQSQKPGFTIIELMLAMGFLGVMLVCIAILVIDITGSYQKGLSLRAVNSVGRQLVDEFSRAVAGAPLNRNLNPIPNVITGRVSEVEINNARSQYFFEFPARTVTVAGATTNDAQRQIYGAFCTGHYTYIWNTARVFDDSEPPDVVALPVVLTNAGGDLAAPRTDYKLLRVIDSEANICKDYAQTVANTGSPPPRIILPAGTSEPIELLNRDEANLVLYDFTVYSASQDILTGQTFYTASFILATQRGGVDIMGVGDYCDPSAGGTGDATRGFVTDFNYCAVNKFSFAMRATGYTEPDQEPEYGNL